MKLLRCLAIAAIVAAAGLLVPAPAVAAPKANFVRYTNVIAYDLKSLQTTRFYCSVDTSNTWAQLKVRTPRGDKYIYRGPIRDANKNFYFPLWNGMGPDGKRLPSSAGYTWELALTRGGQTSTTTGKISISKITFSFSGTVPSEYWSGYYDRYMVAGSANFYVKAQTTRESDTLFVSASGLQVVRSYQPPQRLYLDLGGFPVTVTKPLDRTVHVDNAIVSPTIETFRAHADLGTSFAVTVIQ